MKRFAATLLAILFLLICGCKKSVAEYISDAEGFLKNNFLYTYHNIIQKAESIGKDIISVVEKDEIAPEDVVEIKPKAIQTENDVLSAYSKLDSSRKDLYSIMLTAINNMELKTINITDYVTGDGFSDAVVAHRAVLCDNPNIFWMPKTFSLLSIEGKNNKYLCFRDYYAEKDGMGFYGITKDQKEQMQFKFDSVIKDIMSIADSYSDIFERELFLHDYLCENIEYDNEAAADIANANPQSLTAYGALVNGKSVCEGYSKAMQVLCKMAHIPCNVVYGEHKGVSHMWNIVNLCGELYYLDVTFDDSSSSAVMHIYFNVTKDYISKDHVFYNEILLSETYDDEVDFNFFTYDCDNTALNYFNAKNAYITEDFESAITAILTAHSEGKNSMELKNVTSISPSRAFERLKRKINRDNKEIKLKYCYRYDCENILVAVW